MYQNIMIECQHADNFVQVDSDETVENYYITYVIQQFMQLKNMFYFIFSNKCGLT